MKTFSEHENHSYPPYLSDRGKLQQEKSSQICSYSGTEDNRQFHALLAKYLTADIWVAFGTGKNYTSSYLNAICHSLGKEKSAALPVFHCYTGCDTISAFCGKGKKSAWEDWTSNTEVTQAFDYMAANPHSPLTTDGHTSKCWSVTQSLLTTRRAIRVISMKHGESCSVRRT